MGSLKMVTLFYSGNKQDDYATICASQYTAVRRVQQVYPLKVVIAVSSREGRLSQPELLAILRASERQNPEARLNI